MNAKYQTIALSIDNGVARLVLNRPERRNAISPLACCELIDAIERIRQTDDARVTILSGAGAVFSAGGDLSEMSQSSEAGSRATTFAALFKKIHALGKPMIAMVNGRALGGAVGLVAACDLAIASSEAEFGCTEINLGLWPMVISAEIARSIGRKRALELFLTGRRFDADEARDMGLINRVVASESLESETLELARAMAKKSPVALAMGLKAFYETQDMSHGEAVDHLEERLLALLATADAKEGIQAFLENRAPVWRGR